MASGDRPNAEYQARTCRFDGRYARPFRAPTVRYLSSWDTLDCPVPAPEASFSPGHCRQQGNRLNEPRRTRSSAGQSVALRSWTAAKIIPFEIDFSIAVPSDL